MALWWKEARKEIDDYLQKYNLNPREADRNPSRVIKIMKTPGFKEGCREIVTKYAKKVIKVVFPKDQVMPE